jgi:predicted DNA binding CopG/RHH family protein/uncharacterized protein YwgA
MTNDKWDSLLENDWATGWEALPDAPELVERPKAAQITLRLTGEMVGRVKRVAAARSLPYHALVRSWLVDALRDASVAPPGEIASDARAEQVNIKLEQHVLDRLKTSAHDLGRPYHRLAREWIDAAVGQEEQALGLSEASAGPGIKELLVLLLHATDQRGHNSIKGITRLQKLLFVIEKTVGIQAGNFYAHNYGPFDEGVNDAAEALKLAGFLRGAATQSSGPPTFADMMTTAGGRAGPKGQPAREFALNEEGHALAERLRQSNRAYESLFERIDELRSEWDTPDLLDRVYERWPEYAKESLIKDEVAARRAKRRRS